MHDLVRMRFPQQALEELRQIDPNTPVSLSFIRRLVRTGAIPSVPVGAGKRRLLNFDALLAYLENPLADEAQTARGIRPVDERGRTWYNKGDKVRAIAAADNWRYPAESENLCKTDRDTEYPISWTKGWGN